ncbi:MAG TPA: ATP-binding protein, partial [Polyangiaceae bacterium]|nr:ATP-binding protein [Polyangiaceae bacterium]
ENDDLEMNLQPVDLGQLVKRAVESNAALEPRADVSVTYEPPSSTCMATADSALLSRMVGELLMNAVAHARHTVRAGVFTDENGPSIFVEDDGPGVQEHARASLYQRFVVRDARGGLGIGLSMVKELLLAQSGDVRLEKSELPPGRPGTLGARFVLSLPHVAVTPSPGA